MAKLFQFFDTALKLWKAEELPAGVTHRIHLDAAAMIPRVTDGALVDCEETATYRINRDLLRFPVTGTGKYAQVSFVWPDGWTAADVSFIWKCASGTGSVVWQSQLRCWADGDAVDAVFGTQVAVTDAAASANTVRVSAPASAVTPSGTVAAGALATLQIFRDPTHDSDDCPVDVQLMAVVLTAHAA